MMKKLRTPSLFFLVASSSVMLLFVSSSMLQASAYSATYAPAPPINVTTGGDQKLSQWGSTCSVSGVLWDWYLDSATFNMFYSTSSDGTTWTAPLSAFTENGQAQSGTNIIAAATAAQMCHGSLFSAAWMDSRGGANLWTLDWVQCTLSGTTPTCGPTLFGYTVHGTKFRFPTSSSVYSVRYLNNFEFITTNDYGVGRQLYSTGYTGFNALCAYAICDVLNDTNMNAPYDIGYTGSLYVLVGSCAAGTSSTLCNYMTSANGFFFGSVNTVTTDNGGTTAMFSSIGGLGGDSGLVSSPADGGVYLFYSENHACASGPATADCLGYALIKGAGSVIMGDIVGHSAGDTPVSATTDGTGDFFGVVEWAANGAAGEYCTTTTGRLGTWVCGGFVGAGTTTYGLPAGLGDLVSGGAAAFAMSSQTASSAIVQVFGLPTAGVSTQTQTIGGCPAKDAATFTMANKTIYQYSGNALGQEVVDNISFSVASTVGSGPHTIQALVYVSSAQSPNIIDPLLLVYSKSFVLSSGTVNDVVRLQVNIPLNIGANSAPLPIIPANLWTVALVGDDHIKLNQSFTSGLTTQQGYVSTSAQPGAFSSGGAPVATQLYLCATGSYQSVISVSTTKTVASGTLTTTVSSTSTLTLTSLNGQNIAILGNDNFLLAIIVVLGPALVLAGATKSLFGGILGAVLGISIGVYIGFVPFWTVALVALTLVVLLFVGKGGGGGGSV